MLRNDSRFFTLSSVFIAISATMEIPVQKVLNRFFLYLSITLFGVYIYLLFIQNPCHSIINMGNIILNLRASSKYNCWNIKAFVSNMGDKCITNIRV